jgi:hypothetical protein
VGFLPEDNRGPIIERTYQQGLLLYLEGDAWTLGTTFNRANPPIID